MSSDARAVPAEPSLQVVAEAGSVADARNTRAELVRYALEHNLMDV